MIPETVREWDYLSINPDGAGGFDRHAANRVLAVARASTLGGSDGVRVLTDHHTKLRAQQVVGIIAANGVTLEILPKIDGLSDESDVRRRLVQMLSVVFDLEISSGTIAEVGTQNDTFLEILIRLFCEQLFSAVRKGLPRRYVGFEDDLPALRGRLNITRQFTVLVAQPQWIACRYDNLSPDIPLNQIMKAALRRLSEIARSDANRRRLAELAFVFAEIQAVPVQALPWGKVVLDRTNREWGRLLKFAKLILGDHFQTTSIGDSPGFALLFEMNTLFEEFVGRSLRRSLAREGYQVRLQGPMSHVLIEDGTNALRFRTKPDMVVTQDGVRRVVVDTKWKRLTGKIDDAKHGVSQGDIYQMLAYGHVYQCERLLLIYPHHAGVGLPAGRVSSHRLSGSEDTKIIIATVSLLEPRKAGDRIAELMISERMI